MPEARSAKSKKRYSAKRDRVIDIAAELFAKNGYASTGVADIGEAAGLARGALYYYIGSKDALLTEIHDRVIDPLLLEAAAIDELGLSYRTRLRLISESLLWHIINRHDHVWVFLHEYHQLPSDHREQFREKRQRYAGYINDTLVAGSDAGEVHVEDVSLTTLSFLNLHNYTYQWLRGRGDLEVEYLSAFYCRLFLDGITSPVIDDSNDIDLARGRAVLLEVRAGAASAG